MRVYFCSRNLWDIDVTVMAIVSYSRSQSVSQSVSHQWVFVPLFVDAVLTIDSSDACSSF